MPPFEARLRAAVLVITTVVSWTMLIGQARETQALAHAAVTHARLADAHHGHIVVSDTCAVR